METKKILAITVLIIFFGSILILFLYKTVYEPIRDSYLKYGDKGMLISGFAVILFYLALAGLLYLIKKCIDIL